MTPPTESHELLKSMRKEVARVKATGQQVVALDALDDYFGRLEQAVISSRQNADPMKSHLDITLAHMNWQKDSSLEMFRSVITAGQTALKTALSINGGAAVALLAFVGHSASEAATKPMVAKLALPLFLFVMGTLSSGLAASLTYLTQYSYDNRSKTWGHVANIGSSILIVIAYGLFAYASFIAYKVFATV